jgi:hypothetical protein
LNTCALKFYGTLSYKTVLPTLASKFPFTNPYDPFLREDLKFYGTFLPISFLIIGLYTVVEGETGVAGVLFITGGVYNIAGILLSGTCGIVFCGY